MRVLERYLEKFATQFATDEDLYAIVPQEVPLHGYEQSGANSIVLVDEPLPNHPDLPTFINILYRDTNDEDMQAWELDPSLRTTFVQLDKNDSVGYVFPGLIAQKDLRNWFRWKTGINEAIEAEEKIAAATEAAFKAIQG